MRRSFTSEWLKLRRRGMLAALATVIAITGLVTFLTISRAGVTGRCLPRPDPVGSPSL